jgi:hypothetical protein
MSVIEIKNDIKTDLFLSSELEQNINLTLIDYEKLLKNFDDHFYKNADV